MIKILSLIKKLKAQSSITADDYSNLKKEFENLEADEQEAVKEEVEALADNVEGEDESEEIEELKSIVGSVIDNKNKKFQDNMLAKVQSIIEKEAEKRAKKVGLYATDADEDQVARRKALSNKLRESLKYVIGGSHDEAIVKEMTTDASGTPYSGYITDDQLSAEIRHLTTEYGVSAREFTTISFMEKSYKANSLATDIATFWVDEGGAIKSGQVVLGQSSLEIKKLATIVTLTRELLQEQEIDFVSFIGSRVAEGFAQAEDEAFFIGDGTSTYGSFTGLLNNTNTNLVTLVGTTFASITAEKLLDMQDATPSGALPNSKYYMHRSIFNLVRKLRADAVTGSDSKGEFLYQNPADANQTTIWGRPVVLVEAMPSTSDTASDTAFVLFGDLKKATIRGIRGGITADRFNAGSVRNVADNADINLITTDREAIRWITQVGYIAILPTAVTRLKTADPSA